MNERGCVKQFFKGLKRQLTSFGFEKFSKINYE